VFSFCTAEKDAGNIREFSTESIPPFVFVRIYRVSSHSVLQAKYCTGCILYKSKVAKNAFVGPGIHHRTTRETISPERQPERRLRENRFSLLGSFSRTVSTTPVKLNDAVLGASVVNNGYKHSKNAKLASSSSEHY